METKWLEDFISLVETNNFSRSAALRHVTQPAFSRRIQSLENWLGTDLIDRTTFPTRLTPAGHVFYEQALEMLGGNIHRAAAALGISPSTIYRKMERWQGQPHSHGEVTEAPHVVPSNWTPLQVQLSRRLSPGHDPALARL